MPRNRIIYQTEALYCGPSPATGFHFASGEVNRSPVSGTTNLSGATGLVQQLTRIQDINYTFKVDRTNVNQFGELAAIDRIVLTPPTVSLDFSYLLNAFSNEKKLGFVTDGFNSALNNIINKKSDERNYFIKTVGEGIDAIGEGDTASDVIGIGNGFLSNYSVDVKVGSFPTVKISVEGLNMSFDTGLGTGTLFINPAVNPNDGSRLNNKYLLPKAASHAGTGDLDISVLRPGDVTFSIKRRDASSEANVIQATGDYNTPGQNMDDLADRKIQSFSIALGMARTPIEKLGSRFAFSREINFPLDVTCSIEALVTDLTTGSLSDIINNDSAYNITMKIAKPSEPVLTGTSGGTAVLYTLRNCKVNSQSFSSSLGANKMVTLEFGTQIGGPNQTGVGLFMSGVSGDLSQITNNDVKIVGNTVN